MRGIDRTLPMLPNFSKSEVRGLPLYRVDQFLLSLRSYRGIPHFVAFLALALFTNTDSFAAETDRQPEDAPAFTLDLPVLDAPFNFAHGYSAPSMNQSLALSMDFYNTLHLGIARGLSESPRWARSLALIGADVLSLYLPPGIAWFHEEWHRAVLSSRNIASRNDVYDFKIFSTLIAVSHVRDEDLVRLKQDHPADLVRLSEVGIESQYEMNLALERDAFFFDTTPHNRLLLWLNVTNNIGYMFECTGKRGDEATASQNVYDGADITKRDFTGLDCSAWTYDLHRPDEPYTARGIHPSGVGINRYRSFSDLNAEEKDYLWQQSRLSLVNLLDPFLLGFNRFKGSSLFNEEPFYWNLNLRHHITSFGYSLEANVFLKQAQWNWLMIFHDYVSANRSMPGLEVQLLRKPLSFSEKSLFLSSRAMAWGQPKDQRFGAEMQAGALASVRLGRALTNQVDVYLDPNTSFVLGLEIPVK